MRRYIELTLEKNLFSRSLDWLDGRSDLAFLAILYLTRLILLIPVGLWQDWLNSRLGFDNPWAEEIFSDRLVAFVLLLLFAPLFETLFECTLAYWVVTAVRRLLASSIPPPRPLRPWGFIVLSAIVMTSLHHPSSLLPVLVSALFLAYCYGHFARFGHPRAFFFTALFHAVLNLLPWLLLSAEV